MAIETLPAQTVRLGITLILANGAGRWRFKILLHSDGQLQHDHFLRWRHWPINKIVVDAQVVKELDASTYQFMTLSVMVVKTKNER